MTTPASFWPAGEFPSLCQGCPIRPRARRFVPGFGDPRARLVLVGERPGPCEVGRCRHTADAHPTLIPFVGASGRNVRRPLGIGETDSHDGVFITNVRKCLVDSETPAEHAASVEHCTRVYLQAELNRLSQTRTIVAIGEDALRVLGGRGDIERTHGSVWRQNEITS